MPSSPVRTAEEACCGPCVYKECLHGGEAHLLETLPEHTCVQGSALLQVADDLCQALPARLQPGLRVLLLAAAYHCVQKPRLSRRVLG